MFLGRPSFPGVRKPAASLPFKRRFLVCPVPFSPGPCLIDEPSICREEHLRMRHPLRRAQGVVLCSETPSSGVSRWIVEAALAVIYAVRL